VKALRQVLNYAVACGYVAENVARKVPNPEPKRGEVKFLASWSEVDAVAAEFGSPLPDRRWHRPAPAGVDTARAARRGQGERPALRSPHLRRRQVEDVRQDDSLAAGPPAA